MGPRPKRPPRAELLALLLASLIPAAPAAAHLGHDVLRAERYLKIEVGEAGARFVVSLTLGPTEMMTILERADGDADGQVTQAEADAYMAQWAEGLRADLPVSIDGEPVTLRWGEPFFDPTGPVRAVGGSVELVALHPLDGGEHHIELRDEMRLESLERTDVRLTTEGPVELLGAGPIDQLEGEPLEDFDYGEDSRRAPDAVAMRVRMPGLAHWQKVGIAAGAVFAVLVAGLAWWRLRRS